MALQPMRLTKDLVWFSWILRRRLAAVILGP